MCARSLLITISSSSSTPQNTLNRRFLILIEEQSLLIIPQSVPLDGISNREMSEKSYWRRIISRRQFQIN
jgi:hypothetical protein